MRPQGQPRDPSDPGRRLTVRSISLAYVPTYTRNLDQIEIWWTCIQCTVNPAAAGSSSSQLPSGPPQQPHE
jgi:hypothetical protein